MHALPFKPKIVVARPDQDKHVVDHPAHVSPKAAPALHHPHTGSPPKASPVHAHRLTAESEEENSGALASHPLLEGDLRRVYSVGQHPIAGGGTD